MKPRITSGTLLSALAAVILLSVGTAVGAGADGDEKAVRETAAQFYRALNVMFAGELEPMKQVWSHAEDVTYMGPVNFFGYFYLLISICTSSFLVVFLVFTFLKVSGVVETSPVFNLRSVSFRTFV